MAEATSYTVAGHTAVHTGPDTLVGTLVDSHLLVGVDNKDMPLEPVDAELDRVLKLVPVPEPYLKRRASLFTRS